MVGGSSGEPLRGPADISGRPLHGLWTISGRRRAVAPPTGTRGAGSGCKFRTSATKGRELNCCNSGGNGGTLPAILWSYSLDHSPTALLRPGSAFDLGRSVNRSIRSPDRCSERSGESIRALSLSPV